jgi:hypothetical protein
LRHDASAQIRDRPDRHAATAPLRRLGLEPGLSASSTTCVGGSGARVCSKIGGNSFYYKCLTGCSLDGLRCSSRLTLCKSLVSSEIHWDVQHTKRNAAAGRNPARLEAFPWESRTSQRTPKVPKDYCKRSAKSIPPTLRVVCRQELKINAILHQLYTPFKL